MRVSKFIQECKSRIATGSFIILWVLGSFICGCKEKNSDTLILKETNVLITKGDYSAAILLLDSCVDEGIKTKEIYLNLGICYFNLRSYEKALFYFNQLLEKYPNYSNCYDNRGFLYQKLGKYELSIRDFNKAVSLNPESYKTYANRGYSYFSLYQYELALRDYNKSISLNPDYPYVYNSRGVLFHKMRSIDKAIADFTTALKLKGDYSEASYNLAETLFRKGKSADAKAILYSINVSDSSVLFKVNYLLGIIHISEKDTISACKCFGNLLNKGYADVESFHEKFCEPKVQMLPLQQQIIK